MIAKGNVIINMYEKYLFFWPIDLQSVQLLLKNLFESIFVENIFIKKEN